VSRFQDVRFDPRSSPLSAHLRHIPGKSGNIFRAPPDIGGSTGGPAQSVTAEEGGMKIVIFGLTISSSRGNDHASLWRALIKSLVRLGHRVVFFERDDPAYANGRDLAEIPGGSLVLHEGWDAISGRAEWELRDADIAIVTSRCPDGIAAAELIFDDGGALAVFYDLDTSVTLSYLSRGEPVPYIGPSGLADFDVVLSYTGGRAISALRRHLGARFVSPLFGCIDPDVHQPIALEEPRRASLSFLGGIAEDRREVLKRLLVAPALKRPKERFLLGGVQGPVEVPPTANIDIVSTVPADEHAAFFSASRFTLAITSRDIAPLGWCPSARLFEAAACGTPVLSDEWEGLASFYQPQQEILTVKTTEDVLAALDLSDAAIGKIAKAARERTLAQHTADRRAADLIAICDAVASGLQEPDVEPVKSEPVGR
jgi:spore maturation protein CgeB